MAFANVTECVCCPACGCADNRPYRYEHPACFGGELALGLNRCRRCSLQYISPRLNRQGLEYLYNQGYDVHTVSGANTMDPGISDREYEAFFGYVTRHLPAGGTVLDIGCGVGNFLKKFPADGRFEVEGIEFSEQAASQAAASGLKVIAGDFLEQDYRDGHFDAVVMLCVLEHIPGPKAVLEKVFRVLKPGGYAMIAVPNYRYLRIIADNPIAQRLRKNPSPLHSEEHLQNFTTTTLERIVRDSGFEPLEWGLARPLNVGAPVVKTFKRAAYGIVRCLFALGYHLGGIHLIARKPIADAAPIRGTPHPPRHECPSAMSGRPPVAL